MPHAYRRSHRAWRFSVFLFGHFEFPAQNEGSAHGHDTGSAVRFRSASSRRGGQWERGGGVFDGIHPPCSGTPGTEEWDGSVRCHMAPDVRRLQEELRPKTVN